MESINKEKTICCENNEPKHENRRNTGFHLVSQTCFVYDYNCVWRETMNSLSETVSIITNLGVEKVHKSLKSKMLLGFIGGAMIALGYMAYIMVSAQMPGVAGVLLGASIFPLGLIVILLAGGELITGNMTVVGTAWINKKVTFKEMLANWFVITIGNIIGAVFVALVFGVYLGTFSQFQDHVNQMAQGKVHYDAMRIIVSGMACNWFVGIAVWFSKAFNDPTAKFIGIWFPVMAFVVMGFQHSVANLCLLTAGVAYGGISMMDFITNFTFSYLGNIIGGVVLVGWVYSTASKKAS